MQPGTTYLVIKGDSSPQYPQVPALKQCTATLVVPPPPPPTVELLLTMVDTFGDGWTSGSNVEINGGIYTLDRPSPAGEPESEIDLEVTIFVPVGNYTVTYQTTSHADEQLWSITNTDGTELLNSRTSDAFNECQPNRYE